MRRILPLLIGFFTWTAGQAQPQPPFIFTAYGGLFFPSYTQFKDTYQSNSDLIWGIGVSLPVYSSLYLIGDMSFFKSEALVVPAIDSASALEERFIHVGILSKQPLAGSVLLRLSGGFSYVTIQQRTWSSRPAERFVEADKKIGYFGGIGVEQFLSPHLSLFGDVLYDYRRSRQKELSGDFGGVRLVLGVHAHLF